MKKNNNSSFIVIVGILIATGRLLIGKLNIDNSNELYILVVMAIVNYVAFGFVLLFLNNDFNLSVENKINSSGIPTSKKQNSKKILHFFNIIYLITYLIIGILYIYKYYNATLNDMISIIALSVSIANDGLVEAYSKKYYLFINKLANLLK